MAKQIKFNTEARAALKKGIDIVADAVGSTLGPNGKCVIITDYRDGKPHITKDGVTVARNIELADKIENAGASLIREASLKTVATTGDATTTSTVLAREFIRKADEFIEAGINPITLKPGVAFAEKIILDYIDSVKKAVTDEDITSIARISGNNDPEIGELIAGIYSQIGKDGLIVVEESSGLHTTAETITGIKFDRGYEAPHFVTDTVKDECVLEEPYVLITEHRINSTKDLLPILNPIAKEHKSILIIAQEFDDAVIENFKLNHLQGIIKCCLVKCPSYREYRKSYLKDIAVVVGANLISYDSGLEVKDIGLKDLGKCKKVIINKDTTTIVEGCGDPSAIELRASELKEELKRTLEDPGMDGSFMEKWLRERLGQISGGISLIRVGGTTDLEMKERKDRIDDAVCATRAAIEDGIVLGGGLTYYNASKIHTKFSCGTKLVLSSLPIILKTIMFNSGVETDPDVLLKNKSKNVGFNALTGKTGNLYQLGIIDPAKAVKEALKNAISVLNLYLSTACVIAPEQQFIIP